MNPYDKYSSDNEIPRLTDDMIRGRLKKSFLDSFAFFKGYLHPSTLTPFVISLEAIKEI